MEGVTFLADCHKPALRCRWGSMLSVTAQRSAFFLQSAKQSRGQGASQPETIEAIVAKPF